MNLINDPWLPIIRKNGHQELICPWQLTDQLNTNPIVDLDYPRLDFKGSMIQFLIGLFQTVAMPKTAKEWKNQWDMPPTPESLRQACQKYSPAFNLDGEGPRFMQDLELEELEKNAKPISFLFLDEPGDKTVNENRDLFIKRDRVSSLPVSEAIAALHCLHSQAPGKGSGYQTSLRGGGPLTTLLSPKDLDGNVLWHLVWLNVIPREDAQTLYNISAYDSDDEDVAIEDIFPWMAKTKVTTKEKGLLMKNSHWLQAYWGMPIRIKLCFVRGNNQAISPDFKHQVIATKCYPQPKGVKYEKWIHPLSPYGNKGKSDMYCIKPNEGGLSYKHWLGWTLGQDSLTEKKGVSPSEQISKFSRRKTGIQTQIWAFGYDFYNTNKLRGYQEAKMPLFYFENEEAQGTFKSHVTQLLLAAEEVAKNTRTAVRSAWKADKGELGFIDSEFWQTTEVDFYRMLGKIKARVETDVRDQAADLLQSWHSVICKASQTIFEKRVFSSDMTMENTKRIVDAHQQLMRDNYSKKIKQALGIELKQKKEDK